MKIKVLFLAVFSFISIASIAQTLKLSDMKIDKDLASGKYIASISVKNTTITGMDMQVMCKRVSNKLASGHESNFCWDNCYPPNIDQSAGAVSIKSGETNTTSFVGDLDPAGNPGVSVVRYCFYDKNNVKDSVCQSFTYNVTTAAIADIAAAKPALSAAYPNPSANATQIGYNLGASSSSNAYIFVYNSIGAKMAKLDIDDKQGSLLIPVSSYPSGVYMYSLIIDGKQVATKRFIVSHND